MAMSNQNHIRPWLPCAWTNPRRHPTPRLLKVRRAQGVAPIQNVRAESGSRYRDTGEPTTRNATPLRLLSNNRRDKSRGKHRTIARPQISQPA